MEKFSYLKSVNADFIDEVFEKYLADPQSVDESWRFFFEGIEMGSTVMPQLSTPSTQVKGPYTDVSAEAKVAKLIASYREYGRLLADINPLAQPVQSHPLLDLATFELTQADLNTVFSSGQVIGIGPAKLSDIIAHLKKTYCGSVAVQFGHISDPEARSWVLKKLETPSEQSTLGKETKEFIHHRLTESESFERFLHTRYVAQKRFSIEGGESLIPALDAIIEKSADLGVREIVAGMAHRGRLNVLTHIFGKDPSKIFAEFEGNYLSSPETGEGDVKYHKGYSKDFATRRGKPVHLSLASNPSHLEFVDAVIEGSARARQDLLNDKDRTAVLPIQIHGDASFAGQGVCYEVLNLSGLEGYKTGGTIHLIVNNQVGFTTFPTDSRSTQYCSDLARMLEVPIFHVNGDDPEAVWKVSELAAEWRQTFHSDIFIDLICYRKHGHNEGDEPTFTQPLMYKNIKAHTSTRESYAKSLIDSGVLTQASADAVTESVMGRFSAAQAIAKGDPVKTTPPVFERFWRGLKHGTEADHFNPIKTSIDADVLRTLSKKLSTFPEGFRLHSKLTRFFEARVKAIQDGQGIDWGNAENRAFATLIREGHTVRLSGQDAERGTFTHRHCILTDFETGQKYSPLQNLDKGYAPFQVFNSSLSETGVLGFEYGYSLSSPNSLVIWEAQFGDFANGAQVVIDQFIATSETKWQRMTGIVLLLPHGYEGQGPEHSSARLERFLALCGRGNLIVCNLSTPAQIFHALRRQVKRDFRKPLVIMSPKSMLRHPQAISKLSDLTDENFKEVIDCPDASRTPKSVSKVLLCTGKVYYDLLAAKTQAKRDDIAIVRVEQLSPWPKEMLVDVLKKYPNSARFSWVQEEPRNMGAWAHVFQTWAGGLDNFGESLSSRPITYVGRPTSASPAAGSPKIHEKELKDFLEKAIAD